MFLTKFYRPLHTCMKLVYATEISNLKIFCIIKQKDKLKLLTLEFQGKLGWED